MSYMRAPLAALADVDRYLDNPRERLVLFAGSGSTAGRGYTPLDFDGTASGLVARGWRKDRRRFERGTVVKPMITVFPTRVYTAALLATVTAFGILARGSDSLTEIHKCVPDGGVPQFGDEIAWRWVGGERVRYAYSIPVPDLGAFTYTFPFAVA
jgi:hypothetical protein